MRTLLILGGLVVCVLLVTPSNGDQTESGNNPQGGGGEKGTSDLREFIGQNEDEKANRIDAGSSLAIGQRVQLQPRRQEPSNPRRGKNCPGCFSSLKIDDLKVPKRARRQETKQQPSNPRRRKNCPGCFSSLIVDDLIKPNVPKRARRQERKMRKPKPTKKPALPSMFSLTARHTRTKRDKKPKPSKKPRLRGTDRLERKAKSDRPSRRKTSTSEPHLPNMFVLMSARQPDFSTLERPPKDEGRRERKKKGRKRSHEEKEEKKTRKHHHHHHHPEGEKENIRMHAGSRSPITWPHGRRKEEQGDGKEGSERMKRQQKEGETARRVQNSD